MSILNVGVILVRGSNFLELSSAAVWNSSGAEDEGKEGVVSSGPQTRFVLLWVYMYYTGCVLDSVDNRPITVKHVLGGVSNLDLSVSQNTIHKL